jgi:cell division protein FtsB
VLRISKEGGLGRARRRIPVLLLCLCLTAYLGYHTIQGRHGLWARWSMIERSRTVEREISALEAVRARLEREIRLLDYDRPDPDYVDEIARRMLGFAHPRDRLVLVRPSPATGTAPYVRNKSLP